MGEIFEAGKEYRLRDKSLARIYATDGSGDAPVHGARFCADNGWILTSWHRNGDYTDNNKPHPRDLMAPANTCVRYINVYADGEVSIMHTSRERADAIISPSNIWKPNRTACVRIEFEYRDGQFDD